LPQCFDSSIIDGAMKSMLRSSRWRLVLRSLAWLFVVIGFIGAPIVAFGFIFFIHPIRDDFRLTRVANSGINSREAWQSRIRRLRVAGWMHGDSRHVGQLAGKSTFRRVIERLKSGEEIESCAAGHKDHGFAFITNQNVGETAEAWLDWWRTNKDKNQEEWIDEGFRRAGITLQKPPTNENIAALLTIFGIERTSRAVFTPRIIAPHSVHGPVPPDWLQFNANRFLRDHGIDPLAISGEMFRSEPIRRGLIRYAGWRAEHSEFDIGKATIDENDWAESDYDLKPIMLGRWVPWAAAGVTAVLLAIGWLGVVVMRRIRRMALLER
jgi:hypothetical protein